MKTFFWIGAMLAGCGCGGVLQAGNLAPACMANTLAYYEQAIDETPYECSVGLLNYTDFDLVTASGTDGATVLDAGQIEVTPVVNPGDPGGGFTLSAIDPAAFAVGSGQTATYVIDWYFGIDPGPDASGSSLGMDPPFGDVMITQNYCNDSSLTTNDNGATQCATVGDFNSFDFNPQTLQVTTIPPVLFDSITFSQPAQNYANVMTTIYLNGDDGTSVGCPTGVGGSCFDSVTSDVVVSPEPMSALLGLAGLAVIGLLRKRRV